MQKRSILGIIMIIALIGFVGASFADTVATTSPPPTGPGIPALAPTPVQPATPATIQQGGTGGKGIEIVAKVEIEFKETTAKAWRTANHSYLATDKQLLAANAELQLKNTLVLVKEESGHEKVLQFGADGKYTEQHGALPEKFMTAQISSTKLSLDTSPASAAEKSVALTQQK